MKWKKRIKKWKTLMIRNFQFLEKKKFPANINLVQKLFGVLSFLLWLKFGKERDLNCYYYNLPPFQ